MSFFSQDKRAMPDPGQALPGRSEPMLVPQQHVVLRSPLAPPFGDDVSMAMFGMGCFWGGEKTFWETPGVVSTAVGYSAGFTPNPLYEEVCTGKTGHNEVILVVFDERKVSYESLLKIFWESHDPTQGMRQGVDIGTQYRSGIYCYSPAQKIAAEKSAKVYGEVLAAAGLGPITTEIQDASAFYYAESYHQQFLAKNPQRPSCVIPLEMTGRPAFPG